MRPMRSYLAVVGPSALLFAGALDAQVPPTRPEAAVIVAGLGESGDVDGWIDYADFLGCPHEDAIGRDVLDLVAASAPADGVTASLIERWIDDHERCEYAPLDDWVVEAFGRLAASDGPELSRALSVLPVALRAELAGGLEDLATDSRVSGAARSEITDALLARSEGRDRGFLLLDVFETPKLPRSWVSSWSGEVSMDLGSWWVARLVERTEDIDRDTWITAMDTVLPAYGPRPRWKDPARNSDATTLAGREASPWTLGTSYRAGDLVSYEGLEYLARVAHTAIPGWEPPGQLPLWARVRAGPNWAVQVFYQAGQTVVYEGRTYLAIQGHMSRPGQEPPSTRAYWRRIY